jgi:hypothetical protein
LYMETTGVGVSRDSFFGPKIFQLSFFDHQL